MHDTTTEAELRELLGEPAPAAITKERDRLHELDRAWLAARRPAPPPPGPGRHAADQRPSAADPGPRTARPDAGAGHRRVVEVEQVFSHCAKAFLRSELRDPESRTPDAVPSRAVIVHRLERRGERLEDVERYYGQRYSAGLYPTG